MLAPPLHDANNIANPLLLRGSDFNSIKSIGGGIFYTAPHSPTVELCSELCNDKRELLDASLNASHTAGVIDAFVSTLHWATSQFQHPCHLLVRLEATSYEVETLTRMMRKAEDGGQYYLYALRSFLYWERTFAERELMHFTHNQIWNRLRIFYLSFTSRRCYNKLDTPGKKGPFV